MSLSLLVYYDKVYKRNKKGTDCSMKVHEKLLKPLIETKYLTVDNTDRYRCIVRLFYLNYEKLKYWMYQEEVYEELREDAYFAEYTPRSEEHTSELQSRFDIVCRLLLEKKKNERT